jgi:hypothetical protein
MPCSLLRENLDEDLVLHLVHRISTGISVLNDIKVKYVYSVVSYTTVLICEGVTGVQGQMHHRRTRPKLAPLW